MNQAGSEVITAEGVRWPGLPYGPKTDREMVSYVRTYTYTNIGLGLGIIYKHTYHLHMYSPKRG